ncbi:branched-chain-amino-acid aminotransferase [Diplocarpon rosae]|nr:branched-chain-amino-acid aminotransferase [Diplocarpon rosae]
MLRQLRPIAARCKRSPSRLLGAACQQARFYSVHAEAASTIKLQEIDPSKLSITKTTTPKELVPQDELVFGRTFTDHMLSLEWTASTGWLAPRITPYQNLSLDPASCVFHYAFECFEGMKAYKDSKGQVRLFRPQKNMSRMNKSSARIALPTFDHSAMIQLISKFVQIEERFIPSRRGYSLYLRPTMIGTQRTLGVGPPGSALLYVIASPVGPYYPTGFKAISLEATDYAVRAWPGGVGDKKLGANYAPCIVPQIEAASRGFHQNLKYTMRELADAANEGRLLEAFGAGTAAIVSPIRNISWKGDLVDCGLKTDEEAGPVALRMKDWIEARQYGDEEHEWSYLVPQ